DVLWRHVAASQRQSGADPFGLSERVARKAGWRAALDREAAPVDHPSLREWVWVVVERVDGRPQAVLHHVRLDTGEARSLPLGSERAPWLWDASTSTALRLDAGGYI